MPDYLAKADTTYARANRQWIYGYIEGLVGAPGTLQWQLILSEWVVSGGIWELCHRDGGITTVSNLSVSQSPQPNTNDTELGILGSAQLDTNTFYSDYDFDWYTDSGSTFTGGSGRQQYVASVPAQEHIVGFLIRRKARTDGDVGGHTAAGQWVDSGPFLITDPRDPI